MADIGHRHRRRAPITHFPCAVNCCVAPAATDAVAGVSTTARQRGCRGRDRDARGIRLRSPCRTAITRNVPAVSPAVYSPVPETVPPVADQVTVTLVVLLSLIRPSA